MVVQEPGWEFGRDTGVSTPTLAMSATGSLMTTGSQDLGFNVSSERRCSLTGRSPHLRPGALGILHGQRDEHPLLALQHLYQHHLVPHPRMDQTSPRLASRETSGARQVAMVLANQNNRDYHFWHNRAALPLGTFRILLSDCFCCLMTDEKFALCAVEFWCIAMHRRIELNRIVTWWIVIESNREGSANAHP